MENVALCVWVCLPPIIGAWCCRYLLWPSYCSWGCLIFSSNHFMNVFLRLMICWARSCCVLLWKYISFLIAYKSKFHKLFLLVTRWNFMILKSWHRFFFKKETFSGQLKGFFLWSGLNILDIINPVI